MEQQELFIYDSLIPNYPWYLAEVVEGVELNSTYMEGAAEINVENKFQGEYMNICRIITAPRNGSELNYAENQDFVCVWATAVKKFKLLSYGTVVLVRNADIFLRILPGTPLYAEIERRAKSV